MGELKPCWRCGSDADFGLDVYRRDVARCVVVKCPMHNFWMDVDDWNTRPIEDALRSENAALRGLVEAALMPIGPDSKDRIERERAIEVAILNLDKLCEN